MSTFTYGIKSIEYAPVAGDGGPATSGWKTFGKTKEGTGKLDIADGTTTEFKSEEDVQPILVITTPGAITVDFEVTDPDLVIMPVLFGGDITQVAGPPVVKTWNMPTNPLTPEFTLKLTTLSGFIIIIPRGQFAAKLAGDLSRAALLGVPIKVTALTPAKAGVGALQLVQTAAA